MPNLHRGEIEAEIGSVRRRLVLTLGALAELEAAFGADDLTALAERFGSGGSRRAILFASSVQACVALVRQSATTRSRVFPPREARPDMCASRPRCSPRLSAWRRPAL